MTLFLSHRGESDDAPENTLKAFALAMERDSDGVELDIRLTRDGEVVVVHDGNLKRVCGIDADVASSTLVRLRSLHPVPTLEEVLALMKPGKHVQIELKGSDSGLPPGLKRILDVWPGDRKMLALSSFEDETIRRAALYFPDLPRLLLTDLEQKFGRFPSAGEVLAYIRSLDATGVSFKAAFSADRPFVDELRRLGLRVVCWGVSSDELGLAMARAGVDALTCNHACALRKKFR